VVQSIPIGPALATQEIHERQASMTMPKRIVLVARACTEVLLALSGLREVIGKEISPGGRS
jgi:hypothetical protein